MSNGRPRVDTPALGPARARRTTGRVLAWSGVGAALMACALAAPRIGALPRATTPEALDAPRARPPERHEALRAPVRDALVASPVSTALANVVIAVPESPFPVASAPRHAAPRSRTRPIAPHPAQAAPTAPAAADPLGLDTGSLFTDRR